MSLKSFIVGAATMLWVAQSHPADPISDLVPRELVVAERIRFVDKEDSKRTNFEIAAGKEEVEFRVMGKNGGPGLTMKFVIKEFHDDSSEIQVSLVEKGQTDRVQLIVGQETNVILLGNTGNTSGMSTQPSRRLRQGGPIAPAAR